MILNDHYTLTLASHYASALINDDYSGLDDNEAADLDAFMRELYRDHFEGRITLEPEAESYFGIDEVSGLHADVLDFQFWFIKRTEKETA
jgi:hypothetical protein